MSDLHDFDANIENISGSEYPLTSQWIFWEHSKNEIDGYCKKFIPISKFHTIAGFWNFIHNSSFLEKERFVLMRDGITPRWEDVHHLFGSHLTITLDSTKHNAIIELLIGLVGECMFNESYESLDITGITYVNCPKSKQIRLWSRNDKIQIDMIHFTREYKSIFYKYRIDNFVFNTFAELKEISEQNIAKQSTHPRHSSRWKLH